MMSKLFHALFSTTERTVVTVVVIGVFLWMVIIPGVAKRVQVSINENLAAGIPSEVTVAAQCSGGAPTTIISWQATGKQAEKGYRLNIATTQNFAQPRYVKYVRRGTTSTGAPEGFDPQLTLTPGITYFVRVNYAATGDISTASFTASACNGSTGGGLTEGTEGGLTGDGTSSVDLMVNDAQVMVWTALDTDKVHLRWKSANATSCAYKIDQKTANPVALTGSTDITPGAGNHTITMTCTAASGQTVSDSVRTEQRKRNVSNDYVYTRLDDALIGTITKMPSGTISVDENNGYIPGLTNPSEEYRTSNAWVEGVALDPRVPLVKYGNSTGTVFFYITNSPSSLPTYEGRGVCGDKANFSTLTNLPGTMFGIEGEHGFKVRIPAQFLDGIRHYLSACITNNAGALSDVARYYASDATFFAKDMPFTLTAPTDLKISRSKYGPWVNGPIDVSFDPFKGESVEVYFKWISGGATSCTSNFRLGLKSIEGTSYENSVSGWGTKLYAITCTDPFGAPSTDTVQVNGPVEQTVMVDMKVTAPGSTDKVDGPITVQKGEEVRILWKLRQTASSCTANFTGGPRGGGPFEYSAPVRVDETKIFTINCTGSGETGGDSVTVNVQ